MTETQPSTINSPSEGPIVGLPDYQFPYQAEAPLVLWLDSTTAITARIVSVFSPFTLSCTMLVHISCPSFDGLFVVKLYDRRFSTSLRKQMDAMDWNPNLEAQYQTWLDTTEGANFLAHCASQTSPFWSGRGERAQWSINQLETYLQLRSMRTYHAEVSVYERMAHIQGDRIPRLHAKVNLSHPTVTSSLWNSPGIIIDYIGGFPLTKITLRTPSPQWQSIARHALETVKLIHDRGICNTDVSLRNFLITPDPEQPGRFRTIQIDFGNSVFQEEASSGPQWLAWQGWADEEGKIGLPLERVTRGRIVFSRSAWSSMLLAMGLLPTNTPANG